LITRVALIDAVDVAEAAISAALIFCVPTVTDEVEDDATAASSMRLAETTTVDAALTEIDTSLGSIP
jgi:hypothetical protein